MKRKKGKEIHGAGPGGSSEAAPVLAEGGPKRGLQPQKGDSEDKLGQVPGEGRITEKTSGVMEPWCLALPTPSFHPSLKCRCKGDNGIRELAFIFMWTEPVSRTEPTGQCQDV